MYRIDLNCDIGESIGVYKYGFDEELIKFVTSANIACGFHAGDYNQMSKTVKLCLENGVTIGAHPGFPDLAGFGRRSMNMGYDDIKNMVLYQTGALIAIAKSLGAEVTHVKPHGELYNSAARNPQTAAAVIDAVAILEVPALMVLTASDMVEAARAKGLTVIREGFADRNYNPDGTLVSRNSGNALITDSETAARQALQMVKEKKITCTGGEDIELEVDSICIHGDTPHAVEMAGIIKNIFTKNNIKLINPLRGM